MGLSWSISELHGSWSTWSITSTPLGVWGLQWPELLWWRTLYSAPFNPFPYTLSEKLSVLAVQLLVPHSWILMETGFSMLSSFWWQWSWLWGTDRSGESLYGAFSTTTSASGLKACFTIKSLYFISVTPGLPLKEDQILHLLRIWESPNQQMHWECPPLTQIASQQEKHLLEPSIPVQENLFKPISGGLGGEMYYF